MKKTLTTFAALLMAFGLMAQSSANYWQDVTVGQMDLPENAAPEFNISSMRTLSLNFDEMGSYLEQAPMEDGSEHLLLELPMPDGTTEQFAVVYSPMMEPGLAAKYPEIRTFAGHSLQRTGVDMRFTFSPIGGFYALILSDEGAVRITPYAEGQVVAYKSYFQKDVELNPLSDVFHCGVHGEEEVDMLDQSNLTKDKILDVVNHSPVVAFDRHEYRIAVATTVGFSNNNGNTLSSVMTKVTNTISDINTVMNRDAAIRLNLVDDNDKVFFFGSNGSDPYTDGQTDVMIDENPPVLNDSIGSSNFDIGHVFGTNAGGLAQLGSTCSSEKARGVSCTFGNFTGANFYLIAAHEMGHQFNATHTFNLCDGMNETPSTGYEPGAGSSLMGYSGASDCNTQWLAQMDDPYYHNSAMGRINEFSRDGSSGGICADVISVGNNSPEVSVPFGDGLVIPISTPFQLTAVATDVDNDDADITYSWEQYDLGPASSLGNPIGNAPAFRSYLPTASPTRVFPRLQRIIDNQNHPHEVLPTYSRGLTFRCTARDNDDEAGAHDFAEIAFNANEQAGPFLVMSPNNGTESWEVGAFVEVTWDVANTDASSVNCQSVNILLSLDGGFTYPVTLLSASENDGSAFVTVPNEITDMARVRVEANDNIFFDISNNDFSIIEATQGGFALTVDPETGTACLPEVFDIELQTTAILGFTEDVTFEVTGLPAGAVANYSANPVTPGDLAVLSLDMSAVTESGNFELTITGTADGVPTATRTVDLLVVDNDFSALQLLTPAGASGIGTLPEFSWSDLPNAQTYNIQISTDPTFDIVLESGTDISGTTFTPTIQLEGNTVYYWQISVNNECGMGEWGTTGAFKTLFQSCELYTKAENVGIPSSNGSTVTSTVNISTGGEVSDVNVKNIKGIYNSFGDLEIKLKGPGAEVVLVSEESCFVQSPIDFGFDDESPNSDIPCPPDNGQLFKPLNALTAFDGTTSTGEWELEIKVVTNLGSGGEFTSWELEVCGSALPSDPFVVTNLPMDLPPNEVELLFINTLEVDDDDNSSHDLKFTIVDNTQHGYLSLGSTQLGSGGNFTMTDIYSSQITYTNTNPTATDDSFTFTVEDPDGGFLGTPTYNIIIDENATLESTKDVLSPEGLLVYPNPTSNIVNVEFLDDVHGEITATLFNAQGQLLLENTFDSALGKFQMDVSEMPAGFHLLQITTDNGIYSKKIMVD